MKPFFLHHLLGGDVAKNSHFQMRKIPSHGSIFCITSGGDVEKIGHFQRRTIRSHRTFFVLPPMKISIAKANVLVWKHSKRLHLNENDNFKTGKQSCMVTELHMGAILTKMTIVKRGN